MLTKTPVKRLTSADQALASKWRINSLSSIHNDTPNQTKNNPAKLDLQASKALAEAYLMILEWGKK